MSNAKLSALLVMGALSSSVLNAAGFEKNVLWSGKYQGFGGAAASNVNNSEGLFFNPAGLGFIEGNGDIRLNFSPTFSTFSGPVSSTQGDKKSDMGFAPLGGLTAAHRLSDRFVVGVGAFASGGTNTKYDGINAGALTNGESESSLKLIDFTVGAATNVSKDFSIGIAWRATYATGALASVIPVGGNSKQLKLKELSAWDFGSVRAGAQYRGENLGVGLNIRSPVKLALEGKAELGGAVAAVANGSFDNATVAAEFPFLIALGGDYKIAPKWTLFSEISWANYAANEKLDITASSTTNPTANAILGGVSGSDIILKWKDQWVARLGTEWQAFENYALRAGYVLTSAVTSSKHARATFSPPGLGHTVTAGVGADWGAFDADLAFDYSIVTGSGEDPAVDSTGRSYDFGTQAYAAHLGVSYSY